MALRKDIKNLRGKARRAATKAAKRVAKAAVKQAIKHGPKAVKRREDWVDIAWALINSTEFLYRH